jgi:hypothetical protein
MVAYPGTAAGPDRLRALNNPRPVSVEVSPRTPERPAAIHITGRRVVVTEVTDTWLVEDEWWRAPIARCYVQALLTDGRLLTLFHDRIGGGWYAQRYPSARNG